MKAGDIFKERQKEVSAEIKDIGEEKKGHVRNIVRSMSNPRGGKRKTRRRTTRKRKNQKYIK